MVRHGKEPHARALWSIAQFVTLDSRQPKAHSAPSRAGLLARWEERSRANEVQALSEIPGAALRRRDSASQPEPGPPSVGPEIDWVLVAAVADALCSKAVFTRHELIRMINRHLPEYLGGLSGAQVTALLDELASQALAPGARSCCSPLLRWCRDLADAEP